ncbi:UDP-galactose transporter [Colletotrichum paranaense]|uniref:UDP-galactose transporter n=1 Tax=Colletotrichum paranaense TaxID=1914294 RepID=A0ABQ9SW87_9PEZI|nr:UDP-galactose transporter [Colletotrichum paranaense]KAK1543534.1 UDP-galactose transporter [Colletotrichum paranaense]
MAPNNFARRRYARITAGVVLAMLVCQNAASILLQHKVQSRPQGNSARYEPLSAVVLSEALKLFISLGGAAWAYNNTEDRSAVASGFLDYVRSGHDNAAIPAFLYTLSATSQSFGAYHLSILPYLMLSQVKLILTPIFSKTLLKQTLHPHQWLCLVIMAAGIVMVQVGSLPSSLSDVNSSDAGKDRAFGIVAMLVAGCCSAFAGVYMEAVLKSSERSFMVRNAQLAAYGCLCALGGFLWQSDFSTKGFFLGYTTLVWYFVLLQAMGGFLVSWAVRVSSTIAKNYAQSLGFLSASTIPLLSSPHALSFELYSGIATVLGGVFGSLWKTEMPVDSKVDSDERPKEGSIV